jgi:hypothetical protein
VASGRRPVRKEFREGPQSEYWTYAFWNSVPLAAKSSMFGVCIKPWPYAPIFGRKSSTAMKSTFFCSAMEKLVVGRAPSAERESRKAAAILILFWNSAWTCCSTGRSIPLFERSRIFIFGKKNRRSFWEISRFDTQGFPHDGEDT